MVDVTAFLKIYNEMLYQQTIEIWHTALYFSLNAFAVGYFTFVTLKTFRLTLDLCSRQIDLPIKEHFSMSFLYTHKNCV